MSTVRIQIRRGTAADWTSVNPILAAGEAGFETDTNKIKVGDGTTHWASLDYLTAEADTSTLGGQVASDIANAITTAEGYTDTVVGNLTTDNVAEGSTHLYYTTLRTLNDVNAALVDGHGIVHTYSGGNITISSDITGSNGITKTISGNGIVLSLDNTLNISGGFTSNSLTTGTISATDISGTSLTLTGNLHVGGTTTTVNSSTLNVSDPMIYMGENNTSNAVDLGIVASFTKSGTYQHTGLVRDAVADTWKLFKGVTDEPTTTINFNQATYDSLTLGHLEANSTNISSAYITSANIGDVENAQIQYLKNVTSDIQTQIESKASLSHATFTGTVSLPADTVTNNNLQSDAVTTDKILNSAVTSAKIAAGTIVDGNISSSAAINISKINNLQSFLDAKAPSASPTFTGTVVLPVGTSIGSTTSTELGYVHGVTSAIQTQLDNNASEISTHEGKTTNVHGIADTSALATKTYADNAANTAKSDAESYTDTKIATEVTNRNSAISASLSTAEGYTDTAKADAKSYADGLISTEVTNRNSAIATAKSQAISTAESYTDTAISNLVNGAPATLDTLAEIATALGSDANLSTTLTNSIALKAPINSPTFTGTVTLPAGTVTSGMILDGTIVNADINSSAAIAYSKLNLTGSITSSDIVDGTIATGDIANSAVTTAKIADSAITSAKIADGTIVDADINASAAIAATKISGTAVTQADTGTVTSTMIADGTIVAGDIADGAITSAKILDGTIVNADINASAAIAYSKLNLASSITSSDIVDGTIVNADINASAAIAATKIAGTAVTQADTGTVTSTMIADGTIVNADISASAAIADTKLATIATAGKVSNSATTATDANTASAIVARDASGNFSANLITINQTPTSAGHATSKAYVDNLAAGMNWHAAVQAATTGVLPASTYTDGTTDANGGKGIGATLVATANGALSIDGVNVSNGNRVLVKNQATASQNGIYTVTSNGGTSSKWTLTRATDSDDHIINQVEAGDALYVLYGGTNGNQSFVQTATGTGTNGVLLIGTDVITFTQFSGAATFLAGNGLTRTGNQVDVTTSTLNVTADAVDLATVSQSNSTGSATNSHVSSVTVDTYGRVTGVTTSPINVATSSQQGVATFNTASFAVTNGDVTIKAAGVSNTQLANSSVTVGTTAIALGASSTTLAGLTSVTSTGFTGAFTGNVTGNADTATKLATARNINGVAFDGSAAITVKASTTNALTIGTGLSGSSFDGSGAVTIAIDSTVATLTGTQTLTNKTLTSPIIGTIVNTGTLTLPTSTDTLIGKATTDTLTNKTFDTAGTGNVFKIAGTQISANTGTGSNVLATSPSVTGLSTDTLTTTGNVTVGGNLTVNGTTTTINSTTLNTTEQVLVISNAATPTDVTANGAGITIKGTTDKTIKWYSSTGAVTFSENVDLASGKTYKINGTDVLTSTAVLGVTVTNIATITGSQTLTNKTLTTPVLNGPSVNSAGITFSDSTVQTVAGVPSITSIDNTTFATGTVSLATGLKDYMVKVGASVTITLQQDSAATYPVGSSIDFYANGTGAAFAAGTGVTIINTPGLKFRAVGSVATAMKVAANTWLVFGDLSA